MKLENGDCVVFYRLTNFAVGAKVKIRHSNPLLLQFLFRPFADLRASKIPQDQLNLLLSLLVAKRGGR